MRETLTSSPELFSDISWNLLLLGEETAKKWDHSEFNIEHIIHTLFSSSEFFAFIEKLSIDQDTVLEITEDFLEETTELDIDALDVEFLVDVLSIVDSGDLFDTLGEFDITGATRGKNDESQYNVFLRDGDLVLSRDVNGSIEIQFAVGGNFTLETRTPTWEGVITGNEGEDIIVIINQQN